MLAAGGSPSICRGQVVGLETSNDRVTSVKVQQLLVCGCWFMFFFVHIEIGSNRKGDI